MADRLAISNVPVRRRCLIHVGGYDPMAPDAAHRRFSREIRRFESTWSAATTVGAAAISERGADWAVTAEGPGWSVHADIHLLRWDDLMARAAREPAWRRLPRGVAAGLDFALGGALWGYLRRAWRYALFFLYPAALIVALGALAGLLGLGTARLSGSAPAGVGATVAAGIGLFAWAGRALLLNHLLDDWIFSRDYVHAPDPILEDRLDAAAGRVVEAAGSGAFDEVVVLGHSLGAVLAVDLVDRALARAPSLASGAVPVALVTVGSSIPKLGLHRAARRLRAALGRVAASGVFWVEYQALTDAMNFYKTDPVVALGAGPRGPLIRTVRISRMLDPAYYRRIKRDFFRVHNQFVSGNDRRASYDYFMLACGPFPVRRLAESRTGAVDLLGADGRLAPATRELDPAPSTASGPT